MEGANARAFQGSPDQAPPSLRNIPPLQGGGGSKIQALKNQPELYILAFFGLLQATPILWECSACSGQFGVRVGVGVGVRV